MFNQAGVLGGVVELQTVQQASGLGRRESLIECSGRVGWTNYPARRGCSLLWERKVNVCEFPHASSEVDGGAAVCDFDLSPGAMHVEENEQIGCAITLFASNIYKKEPR